MDDILVFVVALQRSRTSPVEKQSICVFEVRRCLIMVVVVHVDMEWREQFLEERFKRRKKEQEEENRKKVFGETGFHFK